MRLHYTSPLSLPRIAPDVLGALRTASAPGVLVEPPGVERRMLRHAPEFIDDPAGTGLFASLGAETYVSPPAFLTVLPGATLFGYRSLAWDGQFCNDEAGTNPAQTRQLLAALASADPFPNEDTGLIPVLDGDGFVFPSRPVRHQAGTAVVLCSHEPSNYGSFLFRVLPKLHAVRQYGLGDLPVVVWAHNPAFTELLRLAGVPESQVVQHATHHPTAFDRVIAPSLRNPHGFLDPESHALLQSMARDSSAGAGRRRLLYVSRLGQARRGGSTRQMVNEADVAAAMSRLGFEVIEPETLIPAEQIAAFASADMVVGPSGSGLFNVVFCRPGTRVLDIESEPHWIYAHAGLFASCQTRYGIFIGEAEADDPAPVHRRFRLDLAALVSRVTRFMAS